MRKLRGRQPNPTNPDTYAVLGLLVLSFVPYLNALGNAFVYDDVPQLLENPYIHSFRYLGKIFGSTVWTFQGAQGITNYYRPLMSFAYAVIYHFSGPIAFPFHLLNIVLHAAIVVLLFFLTERLFGDRLMALAAAGLFAVHPIHTESVAWIAGLPDLELGLFLLLTFLLYLQLDRAGSERTAPWTSYIAMLAMYFLALLSKEQALVLPAILAVYEHFYRSDRGATSLRIKLSRYLPLFATAAAYLAFRIFGFGGFAPSVSRPELGRGGVILSAIALVGSYLWKLIWPVHLSAFYIFHASNSIREPHVLGGIAGLLLCLGLFAWLWRNAHDLSFAFIWMGALIAPVLNARWLPAAVFAERYLYLPSIGFCWLIAWAATRAWRAAPSEQPVARRLLRQTVPVALGIIAILYGVRTVQRNRDWRDDETVYRRILDEQPDAQFIRTNLGVVYFDRGDMAGAEREWLHSLGPLPPYASTLNDLGLLRDKQKRYDEAINYYQQAIQTRSKYADPYKNMAMTYAETGRTEDADREFREAVTLAPLNSIVRNAYGHFLLDQSRPAEAQEQFAASAANDPNSDALGNLGDLLAQKGETEPARAAYQASIAINSFDNRSLVGLAMLDEKAGRTTEALQEYRASLDTDPTNAGALAGVQRLSAAPAKPSAIDANSSPASIAAH